MQIHRYRKKTDLTISLFQQANILHKISIILQWPNSPLTKNLTILAKLMAFHGKSESENEITIEWLNDNKIKKFQ